MGLLLSILVTCVGVVELLAFYRNVKRRVNYQPIQSSLKDVHERNYKELEGVRDTLANQLEQLNKQTNPPTFRLNNPEDIETELDQKTIASSPRRFLVSEKKNASPTATRRFVVSEELQGIKKSKAQECLPEYLIEEQTQSDGDTPVPLPLPETFLVSEHDVFRKKLGHTEVEVEGELYYRRSPSPFPSFKITAPRNSVCSELLDDADVAEVDEISRSNSPVNEVKVDDILDASASSHRSTQYWDNKALAVNATKSKSRTPSPAKARNFERRRYHSESSGVLNSELINNDDDDDAEEEFVEVEPYTEEMKNCLDGVDAKKGCVKKKYVKRKRIKKTNNLGTNRFEVNEKRANKYNVFEFPGATKSNVDVESKNKNAGAVVGPKPGEPFWVKQNNNGL